MSDQGDYPTMPIKASPYQHQREAYELACRLFGLGKGGGDDDDKMRDLQQKDSKEA